MIDNISSVQWQPEDIFCFWHLFSSMNMFIKGLFLSRHLFTNSTLKGFLSFMHWLNMFVHLTLLSKAVVTNVTIKWMKWCNMFVHIQMAFLLHALAQHECSSYSYLQNCNHKCHNQMNELIQHVCSHPNGFSPSCTGTTYLFILLFWAKL